MHFFKKILLFTIFTITLFSCDKKNNMQASNDKGMNILLFIPGTIAQNSIYDTLAQGVKKAVRQAKENGKAVSLDIVEAGTSQSLWLDKLTAVTAEEKYELIISSNPSLPELAKIVLSKFPNQKFLIFDAFSEGFPQITTFRYNQREQGYVAGYISALVTTSKMKYANSKMKIGLIAGQEYPVMNEIILPAYIEGAHAVNPKIEIDFRIVGNWYDASKSAQLAQTMYADGCDVIMPIAGGANQGVISTASDLGFYVSWFDDSGYSKAEGYVISSATVEQKKLAFEQTLNFINGKLKEGIPTTLGMAEGYVTFIEDDPIYISVIPEYIRKLQNKMLNKIYSREIILSVD